MRCAFLDRPETIRVDFGHNNAHCHEYGPTHGRRKPGRQRTLFTNYIHCLPGDPDSLLKDNQLLEMAQDLYRWRKLVVDCSAAE